MLLDNRILATAHAAMLEDLEDAPSVASLKVRSGNRMTSMEREDKRVAFEAYQRELGWKQKRQNVINATGIELFKLKQEL